MKVLLTGANGYIGMRLLQGLLNSDVEVICCVRDKQRFPVQVQRYKNISVVEADFLDESSLGNLPKNIDAAYYLVHSMSAQTGNFSSLESEAAANFVTYARDSALKHIIYLSGISNDAHLSEHLESRLQVEKILAKAQIRLTILRAGIIVGSGSASFEIIRDLVEKLPVMIAPKWLNTKCQPIAVRNVIQILEGVLKQPEISEGVFDIGGPDVLTYRQMLYQFAEVRGLKRMIITVPVLTPRLSSLWLYFVTSTSYHLARNLVDSMTSDVIARPNALQAALGIEAISYREAVAMAFQKIEQNSVVSSWKDAAVANRSQIQHVLDFIKVPKYGCFKDVKTIRLNRPPEDVLQTIWQIGGERGWYYATFLWKIRGYLDKLSGGIGLRRGRRSPVDLYPGDALDFWRVIVASQEERRLLLYAEMKLPGEAWLEFRIDPDGDEGFLLKQEATFRPKGLFGRLYWYAVWPFHIFVFGGMIRRIAHYPGIQA